MEKELRSSLLAISIFVLSASAFCQHIDNDVVGRYCVPANVMGRAVEEFSIEFYSNHRFKNITRNSGFWGSLLETPGCWSVSGDTIVLDSQVRELTIEGMGNLEYPFEDYTFKVLMLEKGSVDWFDTCPSFRFFSFVTAGNDTLRLAPDDNGFITISKKAHIISAWAELLYVSNRVYIPIDTDYNFFILKYSPYRQFDQEKWILKEDGSINPIDRRSNQYADYDLQRDNRWNTCAKWEDVAPPQQRMRHHGVCTIGHN